MASPFRSTYALPGRIVPSVRDSQRLSYVGAGATLEVWYLDRLGRSLNDLVERIELLRTNDVGLGSLHKVIDTTSPTSELVFHLFGAPAELERDLIRERTMAALRAARARILRLGVGRTGSGIATEKLYLRDSSLFTVRREPG